jgi:hypothetical protein
VFVCVFVFYKNTLLTGADIFTRQFDTLELCETYFKTSYASAVSYDSSSQLAHFKVMPKFVKSAPNFEAKTAITTIIKNRIAYDGILVPTYINDLKWFKKLCESLHLISDRVVFNIIFSSFDEAYIIMETVFPSFQHLTNIITNILIFDVEYSSKNKFNYQCAKKLWGLEKLNYENIVIFDSDFEFINKVDLSALIQEKGDRIYVNSYSISCFDKRVIDNINAFFSTDFKMFPLDMLWVVNKNLFTEFMKFLRTLKPDILEFFLNSQDLYFEIIMYRLYVISQFPGQFILKDINNLCVKYDKKFMWDIPMTKQEQIDNDYEIAISRNIECDKSYYYICVHNDR